jgi:hypothetical protein
MYKHKVSYHDHSNDIFFLSNYCSHLKTLERFFSILSTQIKEILQKSRKKKNDFKLTKILKRNENIELSLSISQRNQELIKVSKTKKLIEIKIEIKDSTKISTSAKKKRRKRTRKTKNSIVIEFSDSKIYKLSLTDC